MDVDDPFESSNMMKRSNSAPSINEPVAAGGSSRATGEHPCITYLSDRQLFSNRLCTSGSLNNIMLNTSPKLYNRIKQLRQEDMTIIDMANREVAHEKEVHSAMQISQSWEDLTTMIASPIKHNNVQFGKQSGGLFGRSSDDPFNVSMRSATSSPSPTKSLRYSLPSFFKPSSSPSPTPSSSPTHTTSTSGRSLFSMRPSTLGSVKRKCEMDAFEPIPKKMGLFTVNNKFEPAQVADIVPAEMNATLVRNSIMCCGGGGPSEGDHSYSFEPLLTQMEESEKSNF